MTARERTLLTVVLSLLAVLGTAVLAHSFFLQPLGLLKAQVLDRDTQLAKRREEIKLEQTYVKRVGELSPRLSRWEKFSLPEGDPRPEAFKTHLNLLRLQYQQYLNELLTECKFKRTTFEPRDFDARTAPKFKPPKQKQPIYHSLTISFSGESDLAGAVKLLDGLYRTPLLHQVKNFSISTQKTSRTSTTSLAVKITVEVLLVSGAERIDKRLAANERIVKDEQKAGVRRGDPLAPFRKLLPSIPRFSGKGKDVEPRVLARNQQDYFSLASSTRNIFVPPSSSTAGLSEDGGPVETLDVVLPYVKLPMIAYSDYYGCWVARLQNHGNKNDSVLLVDGPLPTKSRFQDDKKEQARRMRLNGGVGDDSRHKLEEPLQTWVVKDRFKGTLCEVKAIRIEPLRMFVQVDDRIYVLGVGGDLDKAMHEKDGKGEVVDKSLNQDELKQLGLAPDPVEQLKKVRLTRLFYSKYRKDWEADFVNPSNKNETKTLATVPLESELSAEDEWTVRDSLGDAIVKFQVLRVEKDRLIFVANKKHYSMKVGENLHDVLARPLSEPAVKALGLKAS